MSEFQTDDFPPHSLEEQQRMQEMAARQLEYNIKELQNTRKNQPQETPCKTFYKLKKGVPLSLFIEVYPFNELVDCSLNFELEELKELKRLYSTLDQSDQEFYIDSFRRLQQLINSIQSNKIPGSYGKGFQPWNKQSWKEQVAANQEIKNVLRMPEPSQAEIDEIAYQHYLKDEIPLPPSPPPVQPVQPVQPTSLIGRIKSFFSGGGRKSVKLIKSSRSRSRSKSRSRSRRSKRSKSQSKK
jgi:hypothetical protein